MLNFLTLFLLVYYLSASDLRVKRDSFLLSNFEPAVLNGNLLLMYQNKNTKVLISYLFQMRKKRKKTMALATRKQFSMLVIKTVPTL